MQIVKKSEKEIVEVPVSKTNFNRNKYSSKSIEGVLKLEGYQVYQNHVTYNGDQIPLTNVKLIIKAKQVIISVPKKEPVQPQSNKKTTETSNESLREPLQSVAQN